MPSNVCEPGGFVPLYGLAFGTVGTPACPVDTAHPLPTSTTRPAVAPAPLAGSTTVSATVGPFAPALAWPIWLTLAGTWTGTVRVLRSIDGGVTRLPLTVVGQDWATYAGNAQEAIGEETDPAATYYLAITLTGGTLNYRVAQ